MTVSLQGRSIAITGASSGIGAATAVACAQSGMNVALMARRGDKLEQVADQCRALGVKAITLVGDVTDVAACSELITKSVSTFGSLYSVYANAGYGIEKAGLDLTDSELRQIFEVNFFGTMNTIRPAAAHFATRPFEGDARLRPRGHILICSSCLARMPIPRYGAYSATKAAQAHLGRAMKLELEAKGIAVTTIHPISTASGFFETVKVHTGVSDLAAHTPGFFIQSTEKVARCTVDALKNPKNEVWPGFRGKFTRFGMAVCTLFPFLPDLALRGMARRAV